ncbi:MAG: hypothetical protein ACK46Q_09825 [Hyphomonas sp.]
MTIIRKSLKDIVVSQEDWDLANQIRDEDIDLSDIPELTEEDFRNARLVTPEERMLWSLGIDRVVVEKLREEGTPLRELLNRVLRGYLVAQGQLTERAGSPGVHEEPDDFDRS